MERLRAPRTCPARLDADPALQVLDVRERSEWDAGHIPGSVHAPYHAIDGIPDGIDPAGRSRSSAPQASGAASARASCSAPARPT